MKGRTLTVIAPALLFLSACSTTPVASDRLQVEVVAGSGRAAAMDEWEEVVVSPLFSKLPQEDQVSALRFAASAADERGEHAEAHAYRVMLTDYPSAVPMDVLLRAEGAMRVEDWNDAAAALTALARRWPGEVSLEPRPAFIAHVAFRVGRDKELRPAYLSLVEALFEADFKMVYDTPPDGLWEDLVLDALQRRDLPRALDVAGRIQSVGTLLRMKVDRRFDAVVGANPDQFDLAGAARRASADGQRVMANHPRELYAFVQHAYALFDEGRHQEVLAQCDAILAKIERAPDHAPPYDDLDRSLNWVYNHKAAALRALGRWHEALAVMEQARRLDEQRGPNVSQTLNLAVHYNDAGQPARALDVLQGFECSDAVSPYGCMQLHAARHRAYREMGRQADAAAAFDYLRSHRDEAEGLWAGAVLDVGDMDAAAALLIEQLQDPLERGAALARVQDYRPLPMTPSMRASHERWQQLLARPDVAAAIDAVGRRSEQPIYRTAD